MSDQRREDEAPPAPPVMRPSEPVPKQKPTTWPTVVGAIGAAVAGLHLLGLTCTALMLTVIGGPSTTGPHADWYEAARPPLWLSLSDGIGSFLLAALLLIGSANLIGRKAAGAWQCRIWSWVFIPWSIGWFVVQLALQPPVPEDLETLGPSSHLGGVAGYAFFMCAYIVLLFGWPIFLIVWFGRGRIRAEVREWRASKDQAAG